MCVCFATSSVISWLRGGFPVEFIRRLPHPGFESREEPFPRTSACISRGTGCAEHLLMVSYRRAVFLREVSLARFLGDHFYYLCVVSIVLSQILDTSL